MTEYQEELQHLRRQPAHLPPLDNNLADCLRSIAKKHTSPGMDHWSWHNLLKLPKWAIQALERLLSRCEQLCKWPKHLSNIRLVMLAKDDSCDPLRTRPISILPTLHRLWVRRRVQQLSTWLYAQLPRELMGAVPMHSTSDIVYPAALVMADAGRRKRPAQALLVDKSQCFDRIPRALALALLQHVGLPTCFLRAYFAFLNGANTYMHTSGHLSQSLRIEQGMPQGCTMSVVTILVMTSILVHRLRKTPALTTHVYINDFSHLTECARSLQIAVWEHETFDRHTNFQTSVKKTTVVANAYSSCRRSPPTMLGKPLAVVDDAKLLGLSISSRHQGTEAWAEIPSKVLAVGQAHSTTTCTHPCQVAHCLLEAGC